MFTVSDALALGLFGSSSRLIVIAAAVVVVLAIVVVFFMVLRSDNGESKTARGLAYDPDEGPAGAFGGPSGRGNMSGAAGSEWNAQAPRGFGNDAVHRPSDFGGTVGSASGSPSRPQQPLAPGAWGGGRAWGDDAAAPNSPAAGAPAWGQPPADQPGAWGQPARPAAQPVGQNQPAGWGQPMQGPGNRPSQPVQDIGGGWGDTPAAPGGAPAWGEPAQGGWGAAQPNAARPNGPGWNEPTPAPQQPAWGAAQTPPAQGNGWGNPAMSPPQPASPQQQAGWGGPQVGQQSGWGNQQPGQQQQPGWGGPQGDNAGWGNPPGGQAPANGAGAAAGAARPEARMAYIIIREGKEPGRTFELRKERLSIGRSRESDIFLEDLAVSRLHASIYRDDQGSYILRDENSANGTSVNGQRVNEHRLNEGDEVQVGQTTMTFTRR